VPVHKKSELMDNTPLNNVQFSAIHPIGPGHEIAEN
jgi:hypothetical protein